MGHALPSRRRSIVENLEGRLLFSVPNDPLYDSDGRFTNVNAAAAWDITTGSPNVVVAIIDSGLDITHPDIIPNLFTNPGEIAGDGIDNDGNGYIDDIHGWDFANNDNVTEDSLGHGTHVAGIIGAAGNNGIGSTGINQTVKLLSIKIGNGESLSLDAAIEGLHYLANLKRMYLTSGGTEGANVVVANGSFGGTEFPYNRAFDEAISDAADAGILFVVAAGNDGLNNDPGQDFPSKFTLSLPSVIAVTATDRDDEPAFFTNYGAASVNVAAPGVYIQSTWPFDLDLPNPDDDPIDTVQDGYKIISGTSMASPMVAGIIALEAAANPNATPAQLKQALFDGVDKIPSLQGPNSLPDLVSTAGRVDAYKAVKNILNLAVKTDTATQNAWKGNYGVQGYDIPGDSQSIPTGVGYFVDGATIASTPSAARRDYSLESATSTEKVTTYYKDDDFFDLHFDMGATGSHRVTLYFAPFTGGRRTQRIELWNPRTGGMISSQTISDIRTGTYVTYELSDMVMVRIARDVGRDVVVNGVFIDAPAAGMSGYLNTDTTTSGNWRSRFDAQGAVIVGQTTFPANVTGSITGGVEQVVSASTARKGALLFAGDSKKGNVSYFASDTTETINLAFADDVQHEVSIYAVDFDRQKRAERFDLFDSNNNLLDSREISAFYTGTYVTWRVSGDVHIVVTRLQGPSAVFSGVFIDEAAGVAGHFNGIDSATHGSWKGKYGLDAAFIVGDRDATVSPVAEFSLPQTGGFTNVIATSTRNPAAVQKYVSSTDRVAAELESRSTMTITLNLGDGVTPEQVSFYAADFYHRRLAQRIEVFDAGNNLIASTDMLNFNGGQYATFDLNGDVTVKISNLGTNSQRAVLSAVFYG